MSDCCISRVTSFCWTERSRDDDLWVVCIKNFIDRMSDSTDCMRDSIDCMRDSIDCFDSDWDNACHE